MAKVSERRSIATLLRDEHKSTELINATYKSKSDTNIFSYVLRNRVIFFILTVSSFQNILVFCVNFKFGNRFQHHKIMSNQYEFFNL